MPFQMVRHEPGDDFLGVGGDLALQEIGVGLRLRGGFGDLGDGVFIGVL